MVLKKFFERRLERAGIKINGEESFDIKVLNEKLYFRVLMFGSLGLGESYMDSWFEVKNLDQFFERILRVNLGKSVRFSLIGIFNFVISLLFNLQSKARAFIVGEKHYDAGNDLYEAMLDKRMVYTCGYWKNAKDLDEAQEHKLDLVCRKIGLKKGDRVLDIGCGWGSFLKYAAEKYGVEGVGLTVSIEQAKLARQMCGGLPVEIMVKDYREIKGKFDHVVSLGMFEHVGFKNYRDYMQVAANSLKDDGLFLLHTIGGNESVLTVDPWTGKYIFPGGQLPSIAQIGKSIEGIFVVEDWHNFGADYDKTLMSWFENFDLAWPKLKEKYGNRFYRMWKYYLLSCAGSFRARHVQLWQIVLSKNGLKGGYESIR